MTAEQVRFYLVNAPDDPPVFSAEYQADLRKVISSLLASELQVEAPSWPSKPPRLFSPTARAGILWKNVGTSSAPVQSINQYVAAITAACTSSRAPARRSASFRPRDGHAAGRRVNYIDVTNSDGTKSTPVSTSNAMAFNPASIPRHPAAKSGKPHRDLTERRRYHMPPVVLHPANAATASASGRRTAWPWRARRRSPVGGLPATAPFGQGHPAHVPPPERGNTLWRRTPKLAPVPPGPASWINRGQAER
jgi:hypothetical protein